MNQLTSSCNVTLVPPNSGNKTLSPDLTAGAIVCPFYNKNFGHSIRAGINSNEGYDWPAL